MNKKLPACLVLGLLMSACNSEAPSVPAGTADQAETSTQEVKNDVAEATGPRTAPDGDTGAGFLASQGVALEFPHEINYDILDTSRNGTVRHRVLVEVLGDDFARESENFETSLEKIGYRRASESLDGQRVEQVYVQEGKPTFYLLMQPAGSGPELKNPDAAGSIHIMWNKR